MEVCQGAKGLGVGALAETQTVSISGLHFIWGLWELSTRRETQLSCAWWQSPWQQLGAWLRGRLDYQADYSSSSGRSAEACSPSESDNRNGKTRQNKNQTPPALMSFRSQKREEWKETARWILVDLGNQEREGEGRDANGASGHLSLGPEPGTEMKKFSRTLKIGLWGRRAG